MMMLCCDSCGKSELDDIKLKKCTACKSVRYCSVECQRNHRPQHKRECKKRAAELRDELLFKQPESTHLGDCPICFLPILFLEPSTGIFNAASHPCCSKMICLGCVYSTRLQEMEKSQADQKCPFCRTLYPSDDADAEKMLEKRMEVNDPFAIRGAAGRCWKEGNFTECFKYMTQAAKGGDMEAHQQLAHMYLEGEGVEENMNKAIYHWEEAAIGGHPMARMSLGVVEGDCDSHERAMKHFTIAANHGLDAAVQHLKEGHERGYVSHADFEEALRAHKAAVDATKSPQREEAERNPDLLHVGGKKQTTPKAKK